MGPIARRKTLFLRKNVVGSVLLFSPLRSRDLRLFRIPGSRNCGIPIFFYGFER
jgi:hypothetical protein